MSVWMNESVYVEAAVDPCTVRSPRNTSAGGGMCPLHMGKMEKNVWCACDFVNTEDKRSNAKRNVRRKKHVKPKKEEKKVPPSRSRLFGGHIV